MPYTSDTHPAAAIALKSASVIHVFQCSTNFDCATLRSWSCPKVHSSTMAGLPVLSNKLGFIHGCMSSVIEVRNARPERRSRTITHLDEEPTSEIDTAHLLGTIRKSGGKRTWGVVRPVSVSRRERSKKGREEERTDEHSLGWQRKGGGRKECGELK